MFHVAHRLKETSQDLQQTKEKLSQEEFVSSELASAQDSLYSTARQVHSPCTHPPLVSFLTLFL